MVVPLVAGVIAGVQSLGVFLNNKIVAYFVVIGILLADASVSSVFGYQGAFGSFIQFIINAVTGINIFVPTWFLLILFAVIPPLLWFQSQ